MRVTAFSRKTKETDVSLTLCLDGSGRVEVNTGIGFFDHMLTALAYHAGFDLELTAVGDLNVDCHHTIEDVGIALGTALTQLLADRSGIMRFGSCFIPMDGSLAFCSLDISGRAYLVFNVGFTAQKLGEMDTCMVEEFFRAFACNAGMTMHIKLEYGGNDHHNIEAVFKSAAYALKQALALTGGKAALSAKGCL